MVRDTPPADLMSERRRTVRRLTVKELIGVQLGAGNRGIVVDLSETGMRVQAAARVQMLPSTLLRFNIPGCPEQVAASCEVAWADAFGKAGLRFTGFSGNSLLDLRRWLRSTSAPIVEEKPAGRTLPLPMPKPQVVTAPSYPITTGTLGGRPGEEPRPTNPDTFEARLHAIAQNLMTLTSADGAIVALRKGTGIVCRASAGSAPPIGAPVQQDSGLAGECVRNRALVSCADTERNPRVNREVCQRLNLRATVLVPVVVGGNVEGVLEIFSSRPAAFDNGDMLAITRLAEIVRGLLEKRQPKPVVQPPAAVVEEPRATAAVVAPPPPRPTKEAALKLPRPQNGVLVCDACGHRNPDYVAACEKCDIPLRVPDLEALLDRNLPKIVLAFFMLLAPLASFYAGHQTGAMMQKNKVILQQPSKSQASGTQVASR